MGCLILFLYYIDAQGPQNVAREVIFFSYQRSAISSLRSAVRIQRSAIGQIVLHLSVMEPQKKEESTLADSSFLLSKSLLQFANSPSCCVANLVSLSLTQLLFDVGDNTHAGILISLQANSHLVTIRLVELLTLGSDELANLLGIAKAAVELNLGGLTKLGDKLAGGGRTYIDVAHKRLILEFLNLGRAANW